MKPPSFLKQTLGSFVLALAFGLSAPAALADEAAVAEIQTETPARPAPADFQTALQGLAAHDFNTKQAAVETLAASGHAHTLDILNALADGRLFAAGNATFGPSRQICPPGRRLSSSTNTD